MLSSYRSFFLTERFLIGTSLLRIAIGFIILYNYFVNYWQRYFLWHEFGINMYSDEFKLMSWSLYNLSSSILYFDVIYHLGIIVTIIYLLGYKGRIFTFLTYVFFYSVYIRSFNITDGGDNLLIVNMFFLLFTNNTAYFSLDAALREKTQDLSGLDVFHKFKLIVHNFAVLFCIIQLCIVYFFSGMYQIMGEMWQNGTALYYISQVREFSRPILQDVVDNYIGLTIIISYLSILIKIAFPFVITNKRIKPFIVSAMILFHAGIGMGMGLLTFSLVMIVMELLVFSDSEYRSMHAYIKKTTRKLSVSLKRKTRVWGTAKLIQMRIVVFYDSWCPICTQISVKLRNLDCFRLLQLVSLRDSVLVESYELDAEELVKRMHTVSVGKPGSEKKGIDALYQISIRIPQLWIVAPFLYIFSKLGIGGLLYDYVASRRKVIPVGNCDQACDFVPVGTAKE
ncbi:Sporulation-delaying protein SdpB [compost metagenome]